MLFFTFDSGTSASQILDDIDKTLDAILDLCDSNKDILMDTERTEFLDKHARLSCTRLQSTKCSKLSKILGECESLKMKVNTTCLERREREIRKILAKSLASASSTDASKPSQKSLPVMPASTVTQESRGGSSHALPIAIHRAQRRINSSFIRQHFSQLLPPEILAQLELGTEEVSRALSDASAAPATKLSLRNFESECMIFKGNSAIKSATMNIDSPNAVGATNVHAGARPVHNSPSPIPAVENQSLPQIPAWRERCMIFEGGVADDTTMNIRSPGASGAFSQIITRSDEFT